MNELFDLKRADTFGKAPSCFYYVEEIERMREMVRELVATGEAYSLSTLDLGGRDLIAAGVKPGKQVAICCNARSMPQSTVSSPTTAPHSLRTSTCSCDISSWGDTSHYPGASLSGAEGCKFTPGVILHPL